MTDVTSSSTWLDLVDPSPAELAAVLPPGVQPTALERLQAPLRHDDEPRPRLEAHGNYVFGVLVAPATTPDAIVFQEIDVVITTERLISVHKTPPGGIPFSCPAAKNGLLAHHGPGMCLYVLVDEIAERFLTIIDEIDEDIDELEDRIDNWDAAKIRETISTLRHDILRVRRVLAPTRDLARSVLDDRAELDGSDLFPRDVNIRFADAYDKLLRATDGLDLSRDLLAGVRDYHQSQVANDQNEVMKRLTVVASCLLVPTLIVGLYGQNFKYMPELNWRYGYGWSWMLIIVSTVGQIIYFRRKRWI